MLTNTNETLGSDFVDQICEENGIIKGKLESLGEVFDDAIIGVNANAVLVYDSELVLSILKKSGMKNYRGHYENEILNPSITFGAVDIVKRVSKKEFLKEKYEG